MTLASTNLRPTAQSWSILGLLAPIFDVFAQAKTFRELNALDDTLLKDLGLTRDELWDVARRN